MKVTKENKEFYSQAKEVDFLDKKWELEWYVRALAEAAAWGENINRNKKKNINLKQSKV